MKNRFVFVCVSLMLLTLALLIIYKFDQVKLTANAGGLRAKIEGTSQRQSASQPASSSSQHAGPSVITVTTTGNQSHAVFSAGSAPVVIQYGRP